MSYQIQFNVPYSQPEAERLTVQYFQINKFYQLESKEGLRFRNYDEMKSLLSPRRLAGSVAVQFLESAMSTKVYCQLQLHGERLCNLDDEYFAAFLDHFKKALLEKRIALFPGEKYEQEARFFSKTYLWVMIAFGVVCLTAAMLLKIDYLFILIIFLAPGVGLWAVNRKRRQLQLKNQGG